MKKQIPDHKHITKSKFIPSIVSHVILKNNSPIGFAIEHANKQNKDPNIVNAYVCYPNQIQNAEYGSVYLFNSLAEAQSSFMWQLKGSFNYATLINNLSRQQLNLVDDFWMECSDLFIAGFKNCGISIELS